MYAFPDLYTAALFGEQYKEFLYAWFALTNVAFHLGFIYLFAVFKRDIGYREIILGVVLSLVVSTIGFDAFTHGMHAMIEEGYLSASFRRLADGPNFITLFIMASGAAVLVFYTYSPSHRSVSRAFGAIILSVTVGLQFYFHFIAVEGISKDSYHILKKKMVQFVRLVPQDVLENACHEFRYTCQYGQAGAKLNTTPYPELNRVIIRLQKKTKSNAKDQGIDRYTGISPARYMKTNADGRVYEYRAIVLYFHNPAYHGYVIDLNDYEEAFSVASFYLGLFTMIAALVWVGGGTTLLMAHRQTLKKKAEPGRFR